MAKTSAGLLIYRRERSELKVLLVHPGGPFFVKKNMGVWSIPKGEYREGEDPLEIAKKEVYEETSFQVASDKFISLGTIKQAGGKMVTAFAVEAKENLDTSNIKSNTFSMEWPPRSGKKAEFSEVDRAGWFSITEAKERINPAQVKFLDKLENELLL